MYKWRIDRSIDWFSAQFIEYLDHHSGAKGDRRSEREDDQRQFPAVDEADDKAAYQGRQSHEQQRHLISDTRLDFI